MVVVRWARGHTRAWLRVTVVFLEVALGRRVLVREPEAALRLGRRALEAAGHRALGLDHREFADPVGVRRVVQEDRRVATPGLKPPPKKKRRL